MDGWELWVGEREGEWEARLSWAGVISYFYKGSCSKALTA